MKQPDQVTSGLKRIIVIKAKDLIEAAELLERDNDAGALMRVEKALQRAHKWAERRLKRKA